MTSGGIFLTHTVYHFRKKKFLRCIANFSMTRHGIYSTASAVMEHHKVNS